MAASTLQTKSISSEKFVESCGAILFDLSDLTDIKTCLIQHKDSGEWHFAKGRRNQGEARKDAAVREVMEETGFRCRLLPLTMPTRATPVDAHADVLDKAQVCENLTEPFMCHIRTLKNGKGTKMIWWFVAALEGDEDMGKLPGEVKYLPSFLSWRDALKSLTFQNDRELLQKALSLLQMTYSRIEPLDMELKQSKRIPGNSSSPGQTATISKKAARRAAKDAKAVKRQRLKKEHDQKISES
ncbi:uncharacterized protein N0V89_005131 [Didymosphaeria variabile]|uniref:Nudix hydrolase domain-containing protein n=1 Tax=Didymosphaeria variabile TaxID=1932322 RepID=A0A9W8XMZ2_9PLEO|nr:uncharacterized protein N0V89_005131 [Didymosphaeria variabile]KAJ4353402.1 hypothetical protein N0V89_005131 [Didymosphaeria variabile]